VWTDFAPDIHLFSLPSKTASEVIRGRAPPELRQVHGEVFEIGERTVD
jgi:hypothetical protein